MPRRSPRGARSPGFGPEVRRSGLGTLPKPAPADPAVPKNVKRFGRQTAEITQSRPFGAWGVFIFSARKLAIPNLEGQPAGPELLDLGPTFPARGPNKPPTSAPADLISAGAATAHQSINRRMGDSPSITLSTCLLGYARLSPCLCWNDARLAFQPLCCRRVARTSEPPSGGSGRSLASQAHRSVGALCVPLVMRRRKTNNQKSVARTL